MGGGEKDRGEKEERRREKEGEGGREGGSENGRGKEGGESGRKVVSGYLMFSKVRGKIILPLYILSSVLTYMF